MLTPTTADETASSSDVGLPGPAVSDASSLNSSISVQDNPEDRAPSNPDIEPQTNAIAAAPSISVEQAMAVQAERDIQEASDSALAMFHAFDSIAPTENALDEAAINLIRYLHRRNQVNCAIRTRGFQPNYNAGDRAFRAVMDFVWYILANQDECRSIDIGQTEEYNAAVEGRAAIIAMAADARSRGVPFSDVAGPIRSLRETCEGIIDPQDIAGLNREPVPVRMVITPATRVNPSSDLH